MDQPKNTSKGPLHIPNGLVNTNKDLLLVPNGPMTRSKIKALNALVLNVLTKSDLKGSLEY